MGDIRDESDRQRASAERVRIYVSGLTRPQFQDLTRRLVLYAARLLRGSSLAERVAGHRRRERGAAR